MLRLVTSAGWEGRYEEVMVSLNAYRGVHGGGLGSAADKSLGGADSEFDSFLPVASAMARARKAAIYIVPKCSCDTLRSLLAWFLAGGHDTGSQTMPDAA